MALFLGIDGGGSKTECALADRSGVIGRGSAESCKMQRVGKERAAQNLRTAIDGAITSAKAQLGAVVSCCIGIAGESEPQTTPFITSVLQPIFPRATLTVVGDQVIAHEAAFQGGAGVLVIAGTGSIVYARNEQGRSARIGGWGPAISDEGSGSWIGRRAVALSMRTHDDGA